MSCHSNPAALRGGSAVAARGHRTPATKRAWEGRGVCCTPRDPAARSSFADCLLGLAAQMEGDLCICSALILVARWEGGNANKHGPEHPTQLRLGRWGRHGHKPQQERTRSKNSPEVAQLGLCQVFKCFQSGKFGFEMLSRFVPLKRWHPRKGKIGKTKAMV